jgi:PKD repeat protein
VTTIPVAPIAAFVANTTSGRSPLVVQFTDQSMGSPTSWYWSFGDGTTSLHQNPEHTYTSKKKTQTYTVILTATNAFGSNTERKTKYITIL